MVNLPTETLCLAKMLLLKGDYFNNQSVTIDLIERVTGIKAPYVAKALNHLLKLRIIDIHGLKLDKKCVATENVTTWKNTNGILESVSKKSSREIKTVKDYLAYVEICYDYHSGKRLKDKPTENTSFFLSFDKSKLSDFLAEYISEFQEAMSTEKNKLLFEARKEEVRSFLANAAKTEIAKLKAEQKKQPNLNLILNCHTVYPLPHDMVEILMIMENNGDIIITSIDIFTRVDVDTEQSNVTVNWSCDKVGLIIVDWRNNKLLQKQNNYGLTVKHGFIDDEIPRSYLQINNFPEIPHTKTPALIIKYFFDKAKYDKSFKSYHDFNESLINDEYKVDSDDFAKRIDKINRRVNKITAGAVEKIIIKGKNNTREANIYRWFSDLN